MPTGTLPARTVARRGHHNKGRKFPLDPVNNEDFALMLQTISVRHRRGGVRNQMASWRLRAMIVVMFRSGVRVSELCAFEESDLNPRDGTLLVRHGKGDKARLAIMDDWAWNELEQWLAKRATVKPGALFPVLSGQREGLAMHTSEVRRELRALRAQAGARKRWNPHSMRHGFALGVNREFDDILTVQHALGHESARTTALYLRGADPLEAIAPLRHRKPPLMIVPSTWG